MKKIHSPFSRVVIVMVGLLFSTANLPAASLLNASYDVTREYYKDFNAAFVAHWKAQTGEDVTLQQSHGGSVSTQAGYSRSQKLPRQPKRFSDIAARIPSQS